MQNDEWPRDLFPVSEARAAGVSAGVLRGPRFSAPTYGIRSVTEAKDLVDRCAAVLLRLGEGAVVCGPTAALLWGAPLPPGWEERSVLDIAVEAPRRAPHATGIAGRTLTFRPGDVLVGRRGRLTSPARTWCDLGSALEVADLVAVGDFLLHLRLTAPDELRSASERYPSRRGLSRLRRAIGLLDGRAESRPESLVRVALVTAGVRGIEANVVIRDSSGGFLARVDLCIAWARVVIEYHGDYHRVERGRWRKDRARTGRLRAAGWNVIELTADDLADLPAVVALVRAALRT
ncbi:endonuclease domain-containing protein [Rathayibacter tanaceti]|uniref:DUF559 domain-containing protein n=2 Tax=Rathayibacter tanaceti TaxID=1671680 RepID=A0A162J221_9MICO|nr:DUF559 domain-containing protein [Rathayibacter tanaceti]KZX21047.1 hypothetical protein ACH61_01831 [Rathayibacter tanaceti]QHC56338.1 DUF559 domain-containing protein [Rathayibacter tanaceti]TCO34861.1 uncharacterized protein DUF559 [Rathayibacter tanaceti]